MPVNKTSYLIASRVYAAGVVVLILLMFFVGCFVPPIQKLVDGDCEVCVHCEHCLWEREEDG